MALIACPQCDHQISDKALACPKCGFSLNISIKESAQSNLDFKPRIDDALAAKISAIKEFFSGKVAQSSVITDFDNVEKKPRFNKLQIRLIIVGLALLTIAIIVGLIVKKAQANYNEARNYYERGLLKTELRDYQGAIVNFTEAIRLKPDSAGSYFYRGKAKATIDIKDYQGAIADYTEAIRLKPAYVDGYFERASAKSALKDDQGVIADYTEGIRLKPDDSYGYYLRGFYKAFQLKEKDYQGAIADYTEAIRLSPTDDGFYFSRASAKSDLKDYQGAIADYTEAIRLKPDDADYYRFRGEKKVSLGDRQGGFADYRIALKIHKQKGEDSSYVENLLRGEKTVKSK